MSTEAVDAGTRPEAHHFQAEVTELLRLMVHSVYSETEIFLRELISNASDACDRLRYDAIARPELLDKGGALLDPHPARCRGRHARPSPIPASAWTGRS